MAGTAFGVPHPTVANTWVMFTDSVNDNVVLFAYCTGVPSTTAGIFSHGCLIIRLDSGTGIGALYENIGSLAVPNWRYIEVGTTTTSSSSSSSSTSSSSSSSSSSSTVSTTSSSSSSSTV
jgi:hypothetical protein